ncbi:choice-of-anchor L domain-containing protein [Microcoleus sp. LEGE 07076]|uniref:choice-of-anchor L family PEP-CTERM protein n=1 Tax=Microcoleus sp. LEGE 07076 TaxID=915322 RepID=UPI00187EF3AC|nr:choice-of-anchor L domain-containing protein [Microcoleus sp. LEGE 07076]MBE9184218.1 choice-of-anchor L domain-containing protein [Microcoleus sp. LEGE 07076]
MINFHKMATLTATLTGVMSCLAAPAMAFSVGATNNTENLKNNLLGTNTAGLSNFSISITGNAAAFGTFSNDPFGLRSGVVLSTGKVTDIPGQNRKDNMSTNGSDLNTDFGPKGEEGDLTELNLSFFANSTVEKLFFEYVFGSEEFPEFGCSEFNDDFELLLNGTNLAKLSDGKTVTINHLVPDPNNRSTDHPDYIDNPSLTGIAANIIRLDGFTKVLGFEGLLKQNQRNVLSIRIKDIGDGNLDSAVFIKGGSVGTLKAEPVPEPMTVAGLMVGGAMLAAGRKLRGPK